MQIKDYPRTATFFCALIASAITLMCLCACDDDGDDDSSSCETTNSTDSGSSDSSKEESIIPDAHSGDSFAIVYPASSSVVNSSPTLPITIKGVGLSEEPTSFSVTVTTDREYLQPYGELRRSSNGSWSYSAVYLGGNPPYENHTITARATLPSGPIVASSVDHILRK